MVAISGIKVAGKQARTQNFFNAWRLAVARNVVLAIGAVTACSKPGRSVNAAFEFLSMNKHMKELCLT